MKGLFYAFLAFNLLLMVLTGCAVQSGSNMEGTSLLSISEKDIVTVSDLPKGWDRTELVIRSIDDISEAGVNLGWQKGYRTSFERLETRGEFEVVAESITVYLSEYNTSVDDSLVQITENTEESTFKILEDPGIGDKSVAFKEEWEDYGDVESQYWIVFSVDNVLVSVNDYSYFNEHDYFLLKELAEAQEAKLR